MGVKPSDRSSLSQSTRKPSFKETPVYPPQEGKDFMVVQVHYEVFSMLGMIGCFMAVVAIEAWPFISGASHSLVRDFVEVLLLMTMLYLSIRIRFWILTVASVIWLLVIFSSLPS